MKPENKPNPRASAMPESQEKTQIAFCLGLLNKIAAAFRVDLSEETQAVYLEELWKFTPMRLQVAVQRTIREWDKASMMPPPKFILDRIPELSDDSRAILGRGDKPPDWVPIEQVLDEIQRVANKRRMPPPMTQAEYEARLRELRNQANGKVS